MTIENAGALCPGANKEGIIKMETKKVLIKRAFMFNGTPTVVGKIIDLPRIFALEMCAANKAEFAKEADVKVTETKEKAASAKEEQKNAK